MRPVIGITCSSAPTSEDRPARYYLNQAYIRAIELAGGAPLLIPPLGKDEATRALFEALHGLLLPGGADLQPSTYGATPHPKLGAVDPGLDETEIALACWALERDLPILGICRGQQSLNVAAGGTLFQDIPSEMDDVLAHRVEPRAAMAHAIVVESGSRLCAIVGSTRFEVNSLHHQSVRQVAAGFQVTARAPDGVIEGLEHPGRAFTLSVQFHPEELVPGHTPSTRLFDAFVAAAAKQLEVS